MLVTENLEPDEQVKALEESIVNLKKQHETDLRNATLLRLADMDNLRKDMNRKAQEEQDKMKIDMIRSLTEIMDAFVIMTQQDQNSNIDGLNAIHDLFESFLHNRGVSVISPEGQELNPVEHAVAAVKSDPTVLNNTITEVIQRGYKLNNIVIRPAKVVVNSI